MYITPPITGNDDLDSFNARLARLVAEFGDQLTYNTGTGIITAPDGSTAGYIYRYLSVKYADDTQGTGFSNSPTNKSYYGVYNTQEVVESENWADYTWTQVNPSFGTTRELYYKNLGNRAIDFIISTIPVSGYTEVPSGVIDLDTLVGAGTIGTFELADGSVTEPKLADGAVSIPKISATGTPSSSTYLRGDGVWATLVVPDSGLFLDQIVLTTSTILNNTDTGGHFFHPITDDNRRKIKIEDESVISIPVGSTITIVNFINEVPVKQFSGTIYEIGTGTAGAWSVQPFGKVTLLKVDSNTWVIEGTNYILYVEYLTTESGDYITTESGDRIILEDSWPI